MWPELALGGICACLTLRRRGSKPDELVRLLAVATAHAAGLVEDLEEFMSLEFRGWASMDLGIRDSSAVLNPEVAPEEGHHATSSRALHREWAMVSCGFRVWGLRLKVC